MLSSLVRYFFMALLGQVCLNLWLAALHELTGWDALFIASFAWYEAGAQIINYGSVERVNTFANVILLPFLASAVIYSLLFSLICLVTTVGCRALAKSRLRRTENERLVTVQLQPTRM